MAGVPGEIEKSSQLSLLEYPPDTGNYAVSETQYAVFQHHWQK